VDIDRSEPRDRAVLIVATGVVLHQLIMRWRLRRLARNAALRGR